MKLLISLATVGVLGSASVLPTTTTTPTPKVVENIEKNTFRNNVKGTGASAHSYYHTSFKEDGRGIDYSALYGKSNKEKLYKAVTQGIANNPMAKIFYVEKKYDATRAEYKDLEDYAFVNFLLNGVNTTSYGKVLNKVTYANGETYITNKNK